MIITHKLRLNLTKCHCNPTVDAVQGEANTRQLQITLFSNNTTWTPPAGTTAAVAFLKPDGTRGLYDKLPNGTPATTLSGSTVTAILAPQVLTCAGTVLASIVFYDKDQDTLATFPFKIIVEKNPAAGEKISNNYYTLQNLDQVNAAYAALLDEVADLKSQIDTIRDSGGNADLHIGPNKPTNGALYWLDTSENIPVVPDVPDEPDDPEKALTGITAAYTGGDVAVGTAVTALTGITVTASYYDGSTAAVTGYTLSGTIGEGSNTVTVTYQGKTATFVVTGVAQGGEDGEWEAVTVTNLGSAALTWYSDDGTAKLASTAKARSHTGVFDTDTVVKVTLVFTETQYSALYVGMMSPGATMKFYYAEAFSNDYPYNANKAYERTFTVRAGYALAIGGWPGYSSIESLTVMKKG